MGPRRGVGTAEKAALCKPDVQARWSISGLKKWGPEQVSCDRRLTGSEGDKFQSRTQARSRTDVHFNILCHTPHWSCFCVSWFALNEYILVLEVR